MSKLTSFFNTFFVDVFLKNKKKELALLISNYQSLKDCCLIISNSIIDLSLKLSQSNHDSQIKLNL